MPYRVKLSHCPNPDLPYGYWDGLDPDRARPRMVDAADLAEASRLCRAYIEENNLGGGNWSGGDVLLRGKRVARVSYNGRVWDMSGKEIIP